MPELKPEDVKDKRRTGIYYQNTVVIKAHFMTWHYFILGGTHTSSGLQHSRPTSSIQRDRDLGPRYDKAHTLPGELSQQTIAFKISIMSTSSTSLPPTLPPSLSVTICVLGGGGGTSTNSALPFVVFNLLFPFCRGTNPVSHHMQGMYVLYH